MTEDTSKGKKLLSAVERILEKPERLIEKVEELKKSSKFPDEPDKMKGEIAKRLVRSFSNKSALSGSVVALPGLLPGLGTTAALAGGALVDVTLILKFEVDMSMALAWLYGFDIRDEQERQIAFLMASVKTYEVKTGQNVFFDLAITEGAAIWSYAPREISKLILTVLTKLALIGIGKGLILAVPFVGIAVGGTVNKLLTSSVGKRCCGELERRCIAEAQLRKDIPVREAPAPEVIDVEIEEELEEPAFIQMEPEEPEMEPAFELVEEADEEPEEAEAEESAEEPVKESEPPPDDLEDQPGPKGRSL